MKQQGNTVTLQGVTQSNARVSALMRNIDALALDGAAGWWKSRRQSWISDVSASSQ